METTQKGNPKVLRAVGYCRTSGEGQRDNTSIPRQQEEIEAFVKHRGWQFVRYYIDECKSGSYVEGRHKFQLMLDDAPKSEFDVIVPYDIDRFARDGCDIISNANLLKRAFGISIVAVKGSFNNLNNENVMTNYVYAGMAEQEKLNIIRRTISGRIANARNGKPWTPKLPAGRGYDKEKGKWYINKEGKILQKVLKRYADGEGMRALALEYGFPSSISITRKIHESQLTGAYQAEFNVKAPEIGIKNYKVPVPAIPEVIPASLMKRVKDRLNHNRTWNKQYQRKHLLTGFLRCVHCGRSLCAQNQNGTVYYRHYSHYTDGNKPCIYNSVRADVVEDRALDYLFNFFLDEPAFNKAIRNAMPNEEDRQALESDIKLVKKQIVKLDKEEMNLVKVIREGAKRTTIIIEEQEKIGQERLILETKMNELLQTFANMPDPKLTECDAMYMKIHLMEQYKNRDWRKISYEEIRRFLHFLFGDDPKRNGHGIFVAGNGKRGKKAVWTLTFEGCMEGTNLMQKATDRMNKELRRDYEKAVKQVKKDLYDLNTYHNSN